MKTMASLDDREIVGAVFVLEHLSVWLSSQQDTRMSPRTISIIDDYRSYISWAGRRNKDGKEATEVMALESFASSRE